MPIIPVGIYDLDGCQVHMMGKYVGVCWHMEHHREQRTDEQRRLVTTEWDAPTGEPYIDFLWAQQGVLAGEWYADEKSPVQGGLAPTKAVAVIEELQMAVQYCAERRGRREKYE